MRGLIAYFIAGLYRIPGCECVAIHLRMALYKPDCVSNYCVASGAYILICHCTYSLRFFRLRPIPKLAITQSKPGIRKQSLSYSHFISPPHIPVTHEILASVPKCCLSEGHPRNVCPRLMKEMAVLLLYTLAACHRYGTILLCECVLCRSSCLIG